MKPFSYRKNLLPSQVGSMVYELLRTCLESDEELSLETLLQNLGLSGTESQERCAGEIMTGLMFSAVLATERSTSTRTARAIIAGMTQEFIHHLEEQGASTVQCAEWEANIAATFLTYRNILEDYSGFEPPWKLGREFYWRLIEGERYEAMSIKIATLYLLAARDRVQGFLNECGPLILTEKQ